MTPRTVLSTDWIEIHGSRTYMARVFLTDGGEAYMMTVQDGKKRFFKVDPELLKLGELGFLKKQWKVLKR